MNVSIVRLAWICALVTAASPERAAAESVIEGRVTLPETRSAPVVKRRYEIVSKGGVVAVSPPLAVVYLEGAFPRPEQPRVVQLPQKDLAFATALLPIQVGTRVEFPNLDDTYHNIFSYSAPKRFDLGRYRGDERPIPSETFDMPGLVTLRCDIHEHMRAIVLVLETPYFVVTDPEGNFRLSGVPAGRYILSAWIDSKTTLRQPVEIAPDGTLRVNFP
ncbi:MAG TPA: carboxypeptidase regulatory-like domain-containing protein [Opitutus sp.]|nr:carboxypeptidase regulatory-like domain-containing protein [Opitutus sp.]